MNKYFRYKIFSILKHGEKIILKNNTISYAFLFLKSIFFCNILSGVFINLAKKEPCFFFKKEQS